MKNIKIYMLLAATMSMVAACGSDDDDLGGPQVVATTKRCSTLIRIITLNNQRWQDSNFHG